MKNFFQFAIAGFFGFITDYSAFVWLGLHFSVHASRLLSMLVAVNVTYLINKHLAFRGRDGKYGWYLFGQAKGVLLHFLMFEGIMLALGNVPYVAHIAFISAAVLVLVFNFMYANHLVFK